MAALPWARAVHGDGRRTLGRAAEQAACDHLRARGLTVVRRNYRALRGELDIICRDGDAWVFVEVKARTSDAFGGAAFAVPPDKRRQVAKVARHFLVAHGLLDRVDCRFDVVLVDAGGAPMRVTHIPDAFPGEPA
jgi:putative endonuclease